MTDWIPVIVQIIIAAVALYKLHKTHAWEAGEKATKSLDAVGQQVAEVKATLDGHIRTDAENDAKQARRRIIVFADECRRKVKHSEEHFNSVLDDITAYKHYCDTHPDFANEKAKQSIDYATSVYADCRKNNDFI